MHIYTYTHIHIYTYTHISTNPQIRIPIYPHTSTYPLFLLVCVLYRERLERADHGEGDDLDPYEVLMGLPIELREV